MKVATFLYVLMQSLLFNSCSNFHIRLFPRESFSRYEQEKYAHFPVAATVRTIRLQGAYFV
jgi:hypothetical protein